MNKSYIESLVQKYQSIFRLLDWDIIIRISKQKKPANFAYTDVNVMTKKAIMTFFKPESLYYDTNLEDVVRHEMAHLINAESHSFITSLYQQNKLSEPEWQMYQHYNEKYACQFERFKIA